jgi:hypothetical protein
LQIFSILFRFIPIEGKFERFEIDRTFAQLTIIDKNHFLCIENYSNARENAQNFYLVEMQWEKGRGKLLQTKKFLKWGCIGKLCYFCTYQFSLFQFTNSPIQTNSWLWLSLK